MCAAHRLVPAKLMRDWAELFVSGQPLHDEEETTSSLLADSATMDLVLADEKHRLLSDADFNEYRV